MPNPRLAAFSEVQGYLNINTPENDPKNVSLVQVLEALTPAFENFLKRTLSAGTYTEDYWGSTQTVPLKALPITGITGATFNGQTYLPVTDFTQTPYGYRPISFVPDSSMPVTTVYTGGYAVNGSTELVIQVPLDIKQAFFYQLTHEWKQKDKPGATMIQTAAGSETIPAIGLLDHVKRLLTPYKHPWYMV